MRYLEPETVDEALDLLAEHRDGAIIAGGQSLLILMRDRLVDVEALIGLKAIASLRAIETNGEARIGAMVTHSAVEHDERIAAGWPLLHAAEAAVSTLQVRHRGTLCGNVAHAFPTADPPAALVASDGVVHMASRAGGERAVAAEDFFVGLMQTAAGAEELVTTVSLPAQPEGARTAYIKYAIRPLDFAIVSVAVRIVAAADGTISDARVALAGAANHTSRYRGRRGSSVNVRRRSCSPAPARPRRGRPSRWRTSTARSTTSGASPASTPRGRSHRRERSWVRSISTRTSARASASGSAAPTMRSCR
jgi:carbon-monoxide dehydrogenase medium subunit